MKSGWPIKPLAEVCEFQRGLTYAKGDEVELSNNVVLRANNIDLGTNLLDLAELKYISDSFAVPSSRKIKRDSLLICTASGSKTHLGKVAFVDIDEDYAFGGFMGLLTPTESVLPRYLFHVLTSPAYKDFIAALSDGANINNLKFSDLGRFEIPLPPLPEQRRIVGILDEAFAGIATAKANAEKNLQNARALFESHLHAVFTHRGPSWVEKRLGEVCEFENGDRGKNYPNRSEYVSAGVPWINTGHIEPDGTLTQNEMNFISRAKFEELRSGKIQPGDLVYCLRGATLGKTAVVDPYYEGAVASSLVILRPKESILQRFLFHFLTSPVGRSHIQVHENGAAQPNLGAKSVARYPILLPPLNEQTSITARLDALQTETRRLEALYARKLAALDELKASLLHQAFSGQL